MKQDNTKYEHIPLDRIIFGVRRRVDYGDIPALASKIAEHGLLEPIVLDASRKLVCGGRRFKAFEHLNRKTIPCIILPKVLSDTELRLLEMVENTARKDFTSIEEARTLVELAKETAAELRLKSLFEDNGHDAHIKKSSKNAKPDSDEKVVKRIEENTGLTVSRRTLSRVRTRVEKVQENPDLADKSQYEVLKQTKPEADLLIKLSQVTRLKLADIMKAEEKTVEGAAEAAIEYYHAQLTANYPRLNPPSTEIGGTAPTKEQVRRLTERKSSGPHPNVVKMVMPSYPQFQAGDLCFDKGKGAICKTTLHPKGHHPECPKFPAAQ